MGYRVVALMVVLAAAVAALAAPSARVGRWTASAAGAPVTDAMHARGKIKRVVVIVMENRTFDNVFGGDAVVAGHPQSYPSADAVVPTPIALAMRVTDFVMTAPPGPSPTPPWTGPNNFHNAYQCVASGGFTDAAWQNSVATSMPCASWKFDGPNG
ncbi:MAG: hypothetical protein JO103_12105, partial [Candidatus Eremiobacteraeota bacterium]|nr:hypothetical protein [Candidatus Eremiobacteraeota bacterium]